jgi:hypothetical protein
MAVYGPREHVEEGLRTLEAAARPHIRWMALAQVLRLIIALLLEINGYSPIPVGRLNEPDKE